MKKVVAFDAADHFDNENVIAEYLSAALEDENQNVFLAAVCDVAKARGMAQLAKELALAARASTRLWRLVQSPGMTPC